MNRGPAGATWPAIAFAQRSDPGRDPTKQVNEDAAHYQEMHLGHLLVVCDGMGGHSAGREASHLAVQTIFHEMAHAPPGAPPGDALRAAVAQAGRRVFAFGGGGTNAARPGSTCVAVLVHPGGTDVAHVGDSRAYLVRRGQIRQLTRDHSMVQQMVDAGVLRPEEMATHPDSNKITRALGMTPEVDVELRHEILLQERRDVVLLVTDGVTDVLGDVDLLSLASVAAETGNVGALCEQAIALANARGGPDNTTIQAALVVEPGLVAERIAARAASQTLIGEPALDPLEVRPGGRPPATVPLEPAAPAYATPLPRDPSAVPHSPAPTAGAFGRAPGGTVRLPPIGETLPARNSGAEPSTSTPDSGASRSVWIGLALLVAGACLAGGSLWSLLSEDEAAPPITGAQGDGPRPGRPALSLSTPSSSTSPPSSSR